MTKLNLTPEQEERAVEVHRRAIVVDMQWSTNPALPTPPIDGRNALQRAIGARLAAATATLAAHTATFRSATNEISKVYRLLEAEPDRTLHVLTAAHIERASAEHKLGIIMGFQNASPLEDDWSNTLPIFHRLGVRIIQLTYSERNLLGSGCLEPTDGGLTAYGRQVVGGLNARGILVDLSHAGQKTAMDAIRFSRAPVVFSHANVRALNDHPRNLPDDTIKMLADNGGVMGIVTWAPLYAPRTMAPTLSDYLDNVDYVADLVGVDHVGLGSDMNEGYRINPIPSEFETRYSFQLEGQMKRAPCAEGFEWVHELPNLTRGLVARGYSDEDILKILGGNFLRVAKQVWKEG